MKTKTNNDLKQNTVSPDDAFAKLKALLGADGRTAFFAALIIGLITHMFIMVKDIPNHDGLASEYFDQNMITSGRWFLGTACGISSFYTLPWLIGLLAITYIAVTTVFVVKFFEMKRKSAIILTAGFMVAFPSIVSNFAYVFTMDGYMIGLFLAVLSVFLTKKYKFGWTFGAVALAFSLGIYQAYLPFAMLLCLYEVGRIFLCEKEKLKKIVRYPLMGVIGAALYYVLLQVLLKLQHKELDTYQGINNLEGSGNGGILASVKAMYVDFVKFTLKGNVLFHDKLGLTICTMFAVISVVAIVMLVIKHKLYSNIWLYVTVLMTAVLVPLCTNVILVISKDVTYHLLMRYQWVLFIIFAISILEKSELSVRASGLALAGLLLFTYIVTANISYYNMNEKYEKTYAYCNRLVERIESTPGYYTGMPICMIGVIGNENYPSTSVTGNVTSGIIGADGDYLVYTATNYRDFCKHYLGVTLNISSADENGGYFYNEDYYASMGSFPASDSVKIVDGVMYIKTENRR